MIHHITAICADATRTVDFYTQVLGLRFVKRTVNQDDVEVYHLYFGDRTGSPGSVLTFFTWSNLPPGRVGAGMVSAVAFAAPASSIEAWSKRLAEHGIAVRRERRFDTDVLVFQDPDGLELEIVGHGSEGNWTVDGIAAQHAINGFFGATLLVTQPETTRAVLEKHFGYVLEHNEQGVMRLRSPADRAAVIDVKAATEPMRGIGGLGTVHHIAFRTANLASERVLREAVIEAGLHPTEVIDRFYFRSVYFREPNGILFEIATDDPGFLVDETEATLGTTLSLPPFLEPYRTEITKHLPRIDTEKQR